MFTSKSIQVPSLAKLFVFAVGIMIGIFIPTAIYTILGSLLIAINFLIDYGTTVGTIAVLVLVFLILSKMCQWVVLTLMKGIVVGMIIFYALAMIGGGIL